MYSEKENILPAIKATARSIANYLPVLDFAINFYEEKKSQKAQRKIIRLEKFYHSLLETVGEIQKTLIKTILVEMTLLIFLNRLPLIL